MSKQKKLPDGGERYFVVPAHPYEGVLYWMFEESRSDPERQLSHPYYRGLYSPKSAERAFRSQAAAAICLFEDVMLAPADAFIPRGLQDESVRVLFADDDDWQWRDRRKEIIKAISRHHNIAHFIKRHPTELSNKDDFEFFADRALMHLGTAESQDAALLGGAMFAEFCTLLGESVPRLGDLARHIPALPFGKILNPESLDVFGINFSPADFSAFTSVRSDEEIREYGKRFCHALLNVDHPIDREKEFVRAIRTALDHEAIAKRTAGILETTASTSGVAGLVPVLGIVPGTAGIVADAAARSARAVERKSRWPLVGVRMQEVATRDFLKRKANVAG
jgi:hypothetical protein